MSLRSHNSEFVGLDIPPAPRQLGLNGIMPFGKFVGMTVRECIGDDPEYMDWFNDNVTKVVLNAEARTFLRESASFDPDEADDDDREVFWEEELRSR